METSPELLTLQEAARELRCTTRTLRNYIKAGRIVAVRFAHRWLIARALVTNLARSAGAPA